MDPTNLPSEEEDRPVVPAPVCILYKQPEVASQFADITFIDKNEQQLKEGERYFPFRIAL